MEVKNCVRCGKVFSFVSSSVCRDCEKAEDEQFLLVRDYIHEHRDCTLDEVVAETEVPMKRIAKFIREGRLELAQGMSGDFTCKTCGKEITKGMYCDACHHKLRGDLQNLMAGGVPTNDSVTASNARSKEKTHISKRL